MKSNMSSLTKKLMFFLVFSILCNFATPSAVKDCIDNVKEIFIGFNKPEIDFKIAMTALSEKSITLNFIWEKAANIYGYFKEFGDEINNIGDPTFRSKHQDVLDYFLHHRYEKEYNGVANRIKTMFQDDSSLASIQKDILGYFQSFVAKIENPKHPYISRWIEDNTMSPQGFCEHRELYGVSGVDIDTCNKALCTMFNLRDDDETTEKKNFTEMTGSKAFKYSYLNYTYLDFTTSNLSSQAGSSNDSLHSRLDQDESSKQSQISIMIKYFSHLLYASTRIGEFYYKLDRKLFLTIEEYCVNEVKKRILN